jgi:hypothetical protein
MPAEPEHDPLLTHLESAAAVPLLLPDGTHVDGSLEPGMVLPPRMHAVCRLTSALTVRN